MECELSRNAHQSRRSSWFNRNSPLSETGRRRLARCVVDDGWTLRRAAERFQVSGPPSTLAAMKKLDVALTNCHGIRELNVTFDFKPGNAVAVYAPNGTMKTSLAQTFKDFAKGGETIDRMFRDRESQRSITDEAGAEIDPADVVVVLSYDEDLGPSESASTLLVNAELRKEYEALQADLLAARAVLVAALKAQSGTKQDVSRTVSQAFMPEDDKFFEALMRTKYEVDTLDEPRFSDLPYDVLFNDKLDAILQSKDLQSVLTQYVTRWNELLDESTFFSRETFSYYNAENVTKSLGANGFFAANHSLVLTFLGGCSGPLALGFDSPRDSGYGFHWSARDGRGGLAARCPATTRPLIERCDSIAV